MTRPLPKNAMVSDQMSRMPRSSTGPEVALRKALHRMGLRFRLHRRDLPGTPDVALPGARIAIFVDGCFWHGCPEHGCIPKNNAKWWHDKIVGNPGGCAGFDTRTPTSGGLRIGGSAPRHQRL